MSQFIRQQSKILIGCLCILALAAALIISRVVFSTKSFEVALDENAAGGTIETRLASADRQEEIGAALKDMGYPVESDQYTVDVPLTTKVDDVDQVTITRVADTSTSNGPVVSPTKTDVIDTGSTASVATNEQVEDVVTQEKKYEIRYEAIPFETEQVANDAMTVGETQTTTEGVEGSQKVTELVVYENGQEVSREVTATKVIAEPVNAVVEVGTQPAETVKEETREVTIPYETETRENPDLEVGVTNVLTLGVDGVAQVTEKVTYDANGAEISREEISRITVKESVNEVLEVGTKEAVSETVEETPAVESTPTPAPAPEQPTAEPETPSVSTGTTAQVSDSDFDFICAVVASECNSSYEGALAVISCVMNRVDSGGWGGSDVMGVLKAQGQFSGYLDGYYTRYLGGNYPDYVAQAVRDCLENGIRNHSYESFRSYQTSNSVNIGGNWYF